MDIVMQKKMAKQTGSKRWIDVDETAAELLARVSTERPFFLLPPLHRVPLRIGNVVEIVGPSSSAKTLILIQAAVSCILPKDWKGVHYGGLDRSVMFIDLDCRFEMLFLSEILNHRIMEPNWPTNKADLDRKDISVQKAGTRRKCIAYDEELYALCMRRFLYIRCYDSFEFLSTLKTLQYQLQKDKEMQQSSVRLLLIDSIGAFHWVDRSSTFHPCDSNRKIISLQSISENVVLEIRKLLLVHPLIVIATKTTNSRGRHAANELQRFIPLNPIKFGFFCYALNLGCISVEFKRNFDFRRCSYDFMENCVCLNFSMHFSLEIHNSCEGLPFSMQWNPTSRRISHLIPNQ